MDKREHENAGSATLHHRLRRTLLKLVSPNARGERMRAFAMAMGLKPGMRVIDLGGSTKLWKFVDTPLHVTILNLPSQPIHTQAYGPHTYEFIEGDATDLALPDNRFDIVFSNSVIEHVGCAEQRAAFAAAVRRLAPSYFVQTPARSFPIEAHTVLPFWWYWPGPLRRLIVRRWHAARPAYADFIANTTGVRLQELRHLFPDGMLMRERLAGLVKSYAVYKVGT